MDEAIEHCARGAGIWDWAGTDDGTRDPDIVLACAGDVVTMETVAAAAILARTPAALRTRVVNVVDLMTLPRRKDHPHGMDATLFSELFTDHVDVVFAFHGYPGAIHQLVHGRPDADRFHVRGFIEEGTTTTPFDMVVRNKASRYHLVMDAHQQRASDATRRHRAQGVVRGASWPSTTPTSSSTSRTCRRSATGSSATGPRRADPADGAISGVSCHTRPVRRGPVRPRRRADHDPDAARRGVAELVRRVPRRVGPRRTGPTTARFDPIADYAAHVDGKPRQDGVRDFLASRGIELPKGSPDDPASTETVWGLGNRKQLLVDAELAPGTSRSSRARSPGSVSCGRPGSGPRSCPAVATAPPCWRTSGSATCSTRGSTARRRWRWACPANRPRTCSSRPRDGSVSPRSGRSWWRTRWPGWRRAAPAASGWSSASTGTGTRRASPPQGADVVVDGPRRAARRLTVGRTAPDRASTGCRRRPSASWPRAATTAVDPWRLVERAYNPEDVGRPRRCSPSPTATSASGARRGGRAGLPSR